MLRTHAANVTVHANVIQTMLGGLSNQVSMHGQEFKYSRVTYLDFSGVFFGGVTIDVHLLLSEFSVVVKVDLSVDGVDYSTLANNEYDS